MARRSFYSLLLFGGGVDYGVRPDTCVYLLRPRLDWQVERVVWLAHFKGGDSPFWRLVGPLVFEILSFLRP